MKRSLILATTLSLVGGLHAVGHAATLHVAVNGVDGATCGAKDEPCRSMNQAIRNASDNDTVRVGPGTYTPAVEGNPGGCFCLVRVHKAVKIESVSGAGVTIVDAQGLENSAVRIQADRARFGKTKKGFRLTGGTQAGLTVDIAPAPKGIRIEGNRAEGNGQAGFEINGRDQTVTNNEAVGNGVGFNLRSGRDVTFKGNVAARNDTTGFDVGSTNPTLLKNVAVANGTEGFDLGGQFGGTGAVVLRNVAVGNAGPGMLARTADVTIAHNSLFGNDVAGANCGLENASGATLTAVDNFWGAVTGPGAEPADAACEATGPLEASPFATKEIAVTPGAGR